MTHLSLKRSDWHTNSCKDLQILLSKIKELISDRRNTTGPVHNLIDFVPLLQYLPSFLSPMKARGKKLHNDLIATYGKMLLEVEERLKRQEPVPDCLAKTVLESKEELGLDQLDMAMLCAIFMIAGVFTVGLH